ncbi:MAG: hypothetical protein C6I05_07930 [Epsilonproteobacteria bacterium]|nr:hypothetical protein [Campylobacterota bacterium]
MWLDVAVLFLLEFYESQWQRGKTVGEVIGRAYRRYREGIFYFLFSHPSFYYSLYVGLKYNLTNFWFLSLIFLKFMDISYKLTIFKKIEEGKGGEALPLPLETPVTPIMAYLNLLLYPTLLALALHS